MAELKKPSQVAKKKWEDKQFPDNDKGAMDALAHVSNFKREHMRGAIPDPENVGVWKVSHYHPEMKKYTHSIVYLKGHAWAGYGSRKMQHNDFETHEEY